MKNLLLLFAVLAAGAFVAVSCSTKKSEKLAADSTMTQVIHPEWTRNAVIYEVNLRQYTPEGTIKAFAEHLPRLKELGVDVLWFMPVHPISELNRKGTLGSYYAVKNYTDVNPEFGTLDDFKALVKQIHELGMKVVIDWVPNHSGCDNAWVIEHPDWYEKNEEGKMFGPYDWTDVYSFDYNNPEMRRAMDDAFKFWLTEVDVDGFRCDVAGEVPTDYWDALRPQLDSIKPVFMLAEASKPELSYKAFDMSYNWPLKDLMNAISKTSGANPYAVKKNQKLPVKNALAIDTLLAEQAETYAGDTYMMNMITNHDLNSWEGTEFDRYSDGVEAVAVLSYTLPGMPLIYTGQEVGFNHAFEFFEKDKSPKWEANEYTSFYKTLNELKHNTTAMRAGIKGAPMVRYATKAPNAYVFSRTDENGGVIVMANLSGEELDLDYIKDSPEAAVTVNVFTGKTEQLPQALAPWEYKVYTVK